MLSLAAAASKACIGSLAAARSGSLAANKRCLGSPPAAARPRARGRRIRTEGGVEEGGGGAGEGGWGGTGGPPVVHSPPCPPTHLTSFQPTYLPTKPPAHAL